MYVFVWYTQACVEDTGTEVSCFITLSLIPLRQGDKQKPAAILLSPAPRAGVQTHLHPCLALDMGSGDFKAGPQDYTPSLLIY